MNKSICRWMILGVSLWVAGCQSYRPPTPAPVAFKQPDEVRAGEGFMFLADRRVFATMAFLNATGFDEQPRGVAMHPVRQLVRKRVAENLASHPEKLKQWRRYVKSRDLATWQYQDFALSLQSDYPFQRIRPDKELGYSITGDV